MEYWKLELKKIRVLFIENDKDYQEKLGTFLKDNFDNLEICRDAEEGYLKFQESLSDFRKFDLIISEINLPAMNGLELLQMIRALDNEVSCIFITNSFESELMIKAINLNVQDYILKSFNLKIIDNKLQMICKDILYKKKYELQKNQMKSYMEILNQEALVSKTDLNGKIIFANDGFCEVSGFSRDELMGKSHNIVRHPDISKDLFKDMWTTIKNAKLWVGTLKNLAKDGTTYFINMKIIPIFDLTGKNIVEFMAVRFLVTESEIKKREFQKNYIEQISNYKNKINLINKDRDDLLKKILSLEQKYINLEERNKTFEKRKKDLQFQLSAYEKNSLELDKIELMTKKDKNKQFEEIYKSLNSFKNINSKLEKESNSLRLLCEQKTEELEAFISKEIEYNRRITDLKDLVTNLQKENNELKNKDN